MTLEVHGPRLAVDIGGTFTDLVLDLGDQTLVHKTLTTPRAPEDAVADGVAELLTRSGLTPASLQYFVHGTTLATNAIVERKGARTALIATEGFRDVIEIADEGRHDQYDVFLAKPKPLVPRHLRMTVRERMDAGGRIARPLDEASVLALVPKLAAVGVESVAVALLHSYASPSHELRIRDILQDCLPAVTFCLSSEVCPEIREYERTSTTCANAYVRPLMERYLARLQQRLQAMGVGCPLLLITSSGSLCTIETAQRFPIRLVESGPAGGAILGAALARHLKLDKVLSFDMGGTTAKICLIERGMPKTARSFEVDKVGRFLKGSGLPLRIPVIELVEIGAGGGSIGRVDSLRRVAVGPDSAGSEPGPACYDRGGTHATVTDADLALGRILPEGFAGGRIALVPELANKALEAIAVPGAANATEAAVAVVEVVDETMASAARVHGIEHGATISDHTLIAFGGAAPLHVARLADKLQIDRIIVPAAAGVGSAIGFLAAPVGVEVVRTLHLRLDRGGLARVDCLFEDMREEALGLIGTAASESALVERREALMRYVGQSHEIAVTLPGGKIEDLAKEQLYDLFGQTYRKLFGRIIPEAPVEALTWTLALTATAKGSPVFARVRSATAEASSRSRDVFDFATRRWCKARLADWSNLPTGQELEGPALITDTTTTIYLPGHFVATVDECGNITMTRRIEEA